MRAVSETFHICETCRERVDPADPDVVRAVELVKLTTMGPTTQFAEGLGVFFHRAHYPTGSEQYRLKPD